MEGREMRPALIASLYRKRIAGRSLQVSFLQGNPPAMSIPPCQFHIQPAGQ